MDLNRTRGHNRTGQDFPLNTLAYLNQMQIATLIICALSIVFNGFLLFLHGKDSTLRTGFSVYLNALSIANIITACIQNPLTTAIRDVLTNDQTSVYCFFHILIRSSNAAFTSLCHSVICFNRLWAIILPLSYRLKHGRKMAITICSVTYGIVFLFVLPAVAVDATYPRSPLLNRWCNLNQDLYALRLWYTAFNMMFMVVPELIIVATCPWILCKRHEQQRVRDALTRVTGPSAPNSVEGGGKSGGKSGPVTSGMVNSKKRSEHSVRILIVLTVSVVLCWTPMNAYYLTPSLLYNETLYRSATILKLLHSALDPLLFIAAMDELRKAAVKRFSCVLSRPSRP